MRRAALLVDPWWSLPEVAHRLGLSRRRTLRLIERGPLVGYRRGRGRVVVKGSDLLAFLREGR